MISVYILFSNRIIAYRGGTVKYLILSGLYYKHDYGTIRVGTFG
jgi:hypothetical protein